MALKVLAQPFVTGMRSSALAVEAVKLTACLSPSRFLAAARFHTSPLNVPPPLRCSLTGVVLNGLLEAQSHPSRVGSAELTNFSSGAAERPPLTEEESPSFRKGFFNPSISVRQLALHAMPQLKFPARDTLASKITEHLLAQNSSLWGQRPDLIERVARDFGGRRVSEGQMARDVRSFIAKALGHEPKWYQLFRGNQVMAALKAAKI